MPSLCALGMPRVRHLEGGLREIRSSLGDRLARVLFVLDGATMILLNRALRASALSAGNPVNDNRLKHSLIEAVHLTYGE